MIFKQSRLFNSTCTNALHKPKLDVVKKRVSPSERVKLYSYLDVCVSRGQIERAAQILRTYEKSSSRDVLETGHYNMLLKGWARLGSFDQMINTRIDMIQKDIEPNLETFAYILQAYAKSSLKENRIQAVISDIKTRGLNLSAIFQAAYFSPIDRDEIRVAIRTVVPEFEDEFIPANTTSDCQLLQALPNSPYEIYDLGLGSNLDKLGLWAEHQKLVERKSSIMIKSVAKSRSNSMHSRQQEKAWRKLLSLWADSITKALEESLAALEAQSSTKNKIHLHPYLNSVEQKDLIDIMLDEIELSARNTSFSLPTSLLHIDLGSRVMKRYHRERAIKEGSYGEKLRAYDDYINNYCSNEELLGKMNPREFIQERARLIKNYGVYVDLIESRVNWPINIQASVGRFLYGLILRETKFDPNLFRHPEAEQKPKDLVHAFYTAYMQIGNTHKNKEEFRAHKDIEKLCSKACTVRLRFSYNFLPSSSPPMPWLSASFGGYLTSASELVRVSNSVSDRSTYHSSRHDLRKLYPSLDSLNALGLCPWIVNKSILDLAIELFRSGGDYDLAIPFDESRMNAGAPVLSANATKADKIVYAKQKAKHDQKKREMYSLWSDCLYRLSIANHFRDKIFWFPHNMDFRGRTYAIPPHFNHLGADLARSLLLFAKGKPLGTGGLDWLKIHLVNLVGTMKSATLSERLDYANSILKVEVLDSADNPWTGRRWWTKTENPWQVLACCKEISQAIRSGDPIKYISHLAVHQDGSCNGLQHYAALGRDTSGAIAVNLVPSERPQDVYSRVVDIVESKRMKDARDGNHIARSLEGFIKRKVIKQTVMTTVYGVTRYGARSQIARQLAAYNYPDELIWPSASYLAGKTFDSIKQVFNASRAIQDWLNECAYIIASRFLQPVTWETPLGFTVTQPYAGKKVGSTKFLSSGFSGSAGVLSLDADSLVLNSSKQRTAFPPNYIHSLDSTHMMLTSLHCQRLGVTFVSVHDCYWTHPCTVDQMNRVCREQFVMLHQQPLLEQLSAQFLSRYAKYLDLDDKRSVKVRSSSSKKLMHSPASLTQKLTRSTEISKTRACQALTRVPGQGDLDLSVVLKSTYFFS